MKVYFVDQNNRENYIRIFKKKISYEGLLDAYRRRLRFVCKRVQLEKKRLKKHAFIKHIINAVNKIIAAS